MNRLSYAIASTLLFSIGSSSACRASEQNGHGYPLESLYRARPANFFKLVESKEPAVCTAFLKAINKERVHPDGIYVVTNNTDTTVQETTIITDLGIQWEQHPLGMGRTDLADIDLNGDGKIDHITRSTLALSSRIVHGIFPTKEKYKGEWKQQSVFEHYRDIKHGFEMAHLNDGMHLPVNEDFREVQDIINWIASRDHIVDVVQIGRLLYLVEAPSIIEHNEPFAVMLSKIASDFKRNPICFYRSAKLITKQ